MGLFGVIMIAIAVINLAVTFLLRPKVKSAKSKFEVPTARAGDPVPLFYGTALVAPNCTGFWDKRTNTKKGGQIEEIYLNMMLVFGWGRVNVMHDVVWDEVSCRNHHLTEGGGPVITGFPRTDPGTGEPTAVFFNGNQNAGDPENTTAIFGGDQRGGGVSGTMTFYWGRSNQPADTYLQGKHGGRAHRWPLFAYAKLGGNAGARFYIGANLSAPYPIRLLLQRSAWWETSLSPLGQTEAEATLGFDASIPEIIYDLWTNPKYGIRVDPSRIDVASFVSAAATLRNEDFGNGKIGFGMSVNIADPSQVKQTLDSIYEQADIVPTFSPTTGLLGLKLIRGDYDVNTIPVIRSRNIVGGFKFTRAHPNSTINHVVVKYERFENSNTKRGFVEDAISVNDPANYAMTGTVRSQTYELTHITDRDIARFVAQRILRASSVPLGRLEMRCDRTAYALKRGDVFRLLDSPEPDLEGLVFRVGDIDYGNFENREITITAVEDVFNVNYSGYSTPASDWAPETPDRIFTPEEIDDTIVDVIWGAEF